MVELSQFLQEVNNQSKYLTSSDDDQLFTLVEKMETNHRLRDTYTFYLLFNLTNKPSKLKNLLRNHRWLQKELVNAFKAVKVNKKEWLDEINDYSFYDSSLLNEERLQAFDKSMKTLTNSVRMEKERNTNERLQAYLNQKISNYKNKAAS